MAYVGLPRGTVVNHPPEVTAFLDGIRAQEDVPADLDFTRRASELRGRFQGAKGR
jgi:hypothetical protein